MNIHPSTPIVQFRNTRTRALLHIPQYKILQSRGFTIGGKIKLLENKIDNPSLITHIIEDIDLAICSKFVLLTVLVKPIK